MRFVTAWGGRASSLHASARPDRVAARRRRRRARGGPDALPPSSFACHPRRPAPWPGRPSPPPSPACAPACVPCVSLYECSLYMGARQRLNPDGVHLGDTLHLGLHLADTLHLPPSHVGRLSPAPHLGTRAGGNTQQTHSRSLVDTGQDGQRPSLHVFRPLSCSLTSARSGASVELFLRVLRSSWCALGKGSGARRVCLKQTRELP